MGAGGLEPSIGLWSMQNRTFLLLFRPIFGEKLKTAPPKEIGCRSRKVDVLTRCEKVFEFPILAENQTQFRWRPFFFFFGDHLFLGGKNVWTSELSEKFCLNFRTNRVKLIQEQWKFGSRSFALFSLFQKSPPPFSKSWLRAFRHKQCLKVTVPKCPPPVAPGLTEIKLYM